MRRGILSNGFEYEFDETVADDMEFLDVLAAVMADDSTNQERLIAASKLGDMLLGKEQKNRLYAHIRAEHGRVPVAVFQGLLGELMSGSGDLKN